MQLSVYASIAKFFGKPQHALGWLKMYCMETELFGTSVCQMKPVLMALFPTECLSWLFIFPLKVRKMRYTTLLEELRPSSRLLKHKSKILREHRTDSWCWETTALMATDSHTNLVHTNNPTVWQAKCLWKRTLASTTSGMCKLWKYGKTCLTPPPPICCLHNGFIKSNRAGFVHGTCLCMSLIQCGPQHQFPFYFALTKACGFARAFYALWFWQKRFTCVLMDGFPWGIPSTERHSSPNK